MVSYTNFYETVKEASMRLTNTVVLYDGEPYYVLCCTDHKQDGIFRIYLDPLGHPDGLQINTHNVPYEWFDEGEITRGSKMDEYLTDNPNSRIIRKMMNSPKFNKFRPFPLGMVNKQGSVFYLERHPTRHTQQGLCKNMLYGGEVDLLNRKKDTHSPVSIFDRDFFDTIKGIYPDFKSVLEALKDPDVVNTGAAFSRDFAVMRGPFNTLFLAYKRETVGQITNRDDSEIKLGSGFSHLREIVGDTCSFQSVTVME